jgi:hypothetical protein
MPVYLPGLTFGGLGYGGSSYGYSPYGSPAFPRLTVPTTGGYGGAPYGHASYGSVDIIPPTVTGAQALDGYRVEVFFSEEMENNAAFTDPANYTFTDTFGVPLTTVLIEVGTEGPLGGYTSAIVTHSGSTLGGQYIITANGLQDLAGNFLVNGSASFFAFGDETTVLVSFPFPDTTVRLDFRNSLGQPQDLLTEVQFTPGVDDLSSYEITTTYPIAPTINSATQNPSVLSQVDLDTSLMTSAQYNLIAGPALAYDYTGTVLPDSDPNLIGSVVGTGTSVATSTNGLLLSKSLGAQYGWIFGDLTGRLIAGSSFRADFQIDAGSAVISPPVTNTTFATLTVTDGAVQVNLGLAAVAGTKVIDITSGVYSAQVPAAWDLAGATISLVRNQQGSFYSLLLNGVPLVTFAIAAATGTPTHAAGTSVVLSTSHAVTTFALLQVGVTASSTLFTSAWNFIHNNITPFTGTAVLANDRILTKRGPLVRGWGDATPATVNDVEVRLNGSPLDLAGVNPYVGEIYPAIPIPLAPPGTFTVEVDYIWFTNPAFPLVGLNTRGLTLNTWHRSVGHNNPAVSPTPASSLGVPRTGRFPMGIALGPLERPSPKQIGHRYIGFQKDYSALLNSYTTLRLNQNPHAISEGGVSASSMQEMGSFNGQSTPGEAETPWVLDGVDAGGVVGDGTYRVVDDSSGPYGIGQASIYTRDVDLSLPTAITESGRLKINEYVADGVFTGVGFGIHDGAHLLLIGLLIVDGVQHVGVLLDGEQTHLEEGWTIGPGATAEAVGQGTLILDIDLLPPGVEAGSRFRIPDGNQAGVYTITECGLEATEDGTQVEITFEPELPANTKDFGNDTFQVLFETKWDTDLISLRAQGGFPDETATQVYLGGEISGLVADLTELPPYPAQTALLLPATKEGVAFWGSISRRATSDSTWDFVQYASNPERMTQTVQGLTAFTEMNTLPQDDPNDPWYIVAGFGYAEVDSTGQQVLLKSTSGSSTIDQEYSYTRVEPFLSNKVTTDTEAKFQVESGVLGAGDATLFVRDGIREVIFKTLLYVEGTYTDPDTGSTVTGRGLVTDLPQASLSGLQDPVNAGWSKASGNTLSDPFVRGQTLEFTKTSGAAGRWVSPSLPDPVSVFYEGLISEARLSVESYTTGTAGGIGLTFGSRVKYGSVTRIVGVTLDANVVNLVDSNLTTVASFAVAWDDGLPHTYRLLIDPVADIIVLVVDDTVIGNAAFSSFTPAALAQPFAYVGGVGDGACQYTLHSTSLVPLRPRAKAGSTLGRTFGILLRDSDSDDIDSYRIPRSDSTSALNSSLSAIPVPMDWRSLAHVRLYLDPTWGVSFYRPDLPLPPWATGDFATETTDPTAAWATVEYSSLPVQKLDRGCVGFGAVDPRAITQQRWDFMRYRIRGAIDGFGIAPQGMVLNRYFTFTSGEWNIDTTPEVVTVTSRTSTLVRVADSAIYADRVFVVQVDGAVLSSSAWGFDKDTQSLILASPLPEAQYPVTVTFAPGQPVTKTYLCSQPIEGSVTLLNEGTPVVVRSRDDAATVSVGLGSKINDPEDVLDAAEGMVLNDPYRFVTFSDDENSLYASVEYCTVEDGDAVHLSTLCDGPGPGEGFAAIEIEGQFTSDSFSIEGGPGGPWSNQSPVIRGSGTHFDHTRTLFVSGGGYTDGVLQGGVALPHGTGAAVMYPNARGADWTPNTSGMGMNQDWLLSLVDVTPREDLFDLASLMGDNVPPSSADPATDPNPDGTPGTTGNGACVYQMEDTSTSPFSRLGPYGTGLSVLGIRSLLGGGGVIDGTQFILNGGAPIPVITTVTSGTIQAAN